MKTGSQIKIGDEVYSYSYGSFILRGKIINIIPPTKKCSKYLVFAIGVEELHMEPNLPYVYNNITENDVFYIVPESKEEILFLNELLKVHEKSVKQNIVETLKDLFDLQ